MPSTVTVVGSRGRMGTMLVERLTQAGHRVSGVDQPLAEEALASACAEARVVMLCVPAAAMAEVAGRVAPHMPGGAILADIVSVKVLPMRAMEKWYSGPVVGTHPLFGPRSAHEEQAVCVTPGAGADEEHITVVEALFQSIGCTTFRATAEEHDRAMASIQGLNFMTSLAYFAMMSNQKGITRYVTPSFRRRMEAARTMLTVDADMFAGMVAANPLSQEVVREYRRYLNVAAGGDVDMLAQLARRWFACD